MADTNKPERPPLDLSKVRNAEEFSDAVRRSGGVITDGPVPADFTEGWCVHPFVGKKAHHWTADRTVVLPEEPECYSVLSACGLDTVVTRQVPLCAAGNFEFCSRCESRLMKANQLAIRASFGKKT